MPTPALFLDRDGVINEEVGYLHKAEDVRWVPGIFELCRLATGLGYRLVVVTNQAGIGRGFYTQVDFDTLTQWMQAEFAAREVTLAAVYCCPYHPTHGIGDYKREHEDRKPSPGMLRRAVTDLDVDLAQSILVGDRCSDVGAANAAGLKQAFLLSGTETEPCTGSFLPISSLAEVAHWLQAQSEVA